MKELPTILIVDDMDLNRCALRDLCVILGYDPVLADGGRAALDIMETSPPDLVLLDIMMPDVDGYVVLDKMKAKPELRKIPVIVISGVGQMRSVVRCIQKGAIDYLHKPFDPILLRARIEATLDIKRLRDREERYRIRVEEEKKRADDLLRAIFPNEVVTQLKETGVVKPQRHDNLAVLFCDVSGFTQYCEALAPETVVSHLQEMVEALEEIAARHELHKLKTIGDSFMATCGLLQKQDAPVINCIRAGLEMTKIVPSLRAGWQVRVGIHIGPVVAGVVGNQQYLFDIWGDTVNTAARIEQHGAIGAVNLSEKAWRQAEGQFSGVSSGRIHVKGKKEMDIYRLFGSVEETPLSMLENEDVLYPCPSSVGT